MKKKKKFQKGKKKGVLGKSVDNKYTMRKGTNPCCGLSMSLYIIWSMFEGFYNFLYY